MTDFAQYKAINAKLKKRFLLRKPNLSEISEQFAALGRELRDFKTYAGFCSLAVARCEHNTGNAPGELQALLEAARQLKHSDQQNAAVSAYRHALKVCEEPMVNPIISELAKFYKHNNNFMEAAETFLEGSLFKEAAECYLLAHQFELALNCLNNCRREDLTPSDLVTIFLIKLFINDPLKCEFHLPVVPCHADNDKFNELNILLESLLMSFRIKSEDEDECRKTLANQLFPKLDGPQSEILFRIVTQKSF